MNAADLSLLRQIAERIDTGEADPQASRALVVFNVTERALSGTTVFRANMAWPKSLSLPPILLTDSAGHGVPCAVSEINESPDKKGRADHCHLSFALRFTVQDVPAQGWRTFIASYADASPILPPDLADAETPGLIVIETLPHAGDLPANGTF